MLLQANVEFFTQYKKNLFIGLDLSTKCYIVCVTASTSITKPPNGFGIYDFLNDVFDRTIQEIRSAERTFKDCDPYKSYLSESQREIINSQQEALKKALKNITNPL